MRTPVPRLLALLLALAVALAPGRARAGSVLGLSPNPAGNELRRLDPVSGNSTLLLQTGLATLKASASAVHPTNGLLHVAGATSAAPTQMRLLTIDPQTQGVHHDVALDRRFSNLHVRQDGVLIGLCWSGSAEELRTVSPATGSSAVLGTVPGLAVVIPAAGALDRAANRLYQAGFSASRPSVPQLFVLNALTGALVDSLPLARPIQTLMMRADGALLGLYRDGLQQVLTQVDKTTGTESLLRSFQGFSFVAPAAGVVDAGTNLFHQITHAAAAADPAVLHSLWAGVGGPETSVPADARFARLLYSPLTPSVAVEPDQPALAFALSAGEPNPFADRTVLRYSLPADADVQLAVYDLSGRLVRTLASGRRSAGRHVAVWDAADTRGRRVQAGIYFGVLQAGGRQQTSKLLLAR